MDLCLYCKTSPSRSSIEKVIIPLGFVRQEIPVRGHHYFWFEDENLASLRGCFLSWDRFKRGDDWPRAGRHTKIVFTATTKAGRSYEDIEMQNNVIRELRRHFGGSIYEEWSQRQAYISNDVPKLTYSEKRCGLVLNRALNALGRLKFLPDDPTHDQAAQTKVMEDFGIPWASNAAMVNNLLLVFLVAILEDFLRGFFVAYLDSQPRIVERVYERQGRIEYQALRDLLAGKTSLAELEASNYSFQSLEAANAAYNRYVDFNLFKIWSKRKKSSGKFYVVRDVIGELIETRHRIVHEAYVDPVLDKAKTNRYIGGVENALRLLVEALENEKGFRIDLEKHV